MCRRTYRLAKGSALSNGDLVTVFKTEGGGNVYSQVLVSLLITGVFGDVVEVFTSDDGGTVHLGGNDGASQDTATDGYLAGEWAFLV